MAKGDILQTKVDGSNPGTITVSFAATPANGDLLVFITHIYAGGDAAGCAMALATELTDTADAGETNFRRTQIFARVCGASETNSYPITSAVDIWKESTCLRIEGPFTDLSGITALTERFANYVSSLANPASAQAYASAMRAIVAAGADGAAATAFSGFPAATVNGGLYTSSQVFSGSGNFQTTASFAAEQGGASVSGILIQLSAPLLSWVAEPAVSGSPTSAGGLITLTPSLNATVKMIDTVSGSAQPDGAAWAAAPVHGTSTGYSVYNVTITGQAESTTRRKWFQITDGTTTLYGYADLTTTAPSHTILQVNGGQPIQYDQTSFDLTWDAVPGSLSAVSLNGVAQGAHTSVNSTTTRVARTSSMWPLTKYGTPINLVTGAVTVSTSMRETTGYKAVTLVGYVENPPATPDITFGGDDTVVATDGGQYVFATESNTVDMDPNGEWKFATGFDGNVTIAYVDPADGVHSAFESDYYGASANITPDAPNLGGNVTGANPSTNYDISFVLSGDGLDSGVDVQVVAVGAMLVSLTNGSGYGPSVTRQKGQTVYGRMVSGAFGAVVSGGVTVNGVSATKQITTRAANAPSITTQPSNQSVTSGAVATFNVVATNAATYQWQKDTAGNGSYANISGATSATYARTTSDADLGTSNVRCVVTSSEGASTTSASATLTVIAAATRLVIPAGVVTGRGASMAGATAVPVNIRNVNGALIHSTTVTIAASGVTNIDSNQNGAVGTDRFVGFPSSVDGSEALIRLTVQAAS